MKKLQLKDLQSVSLDILKDVDAFCRANNIRYCVAYGTLIGAVRHKGFIPWDDDIDIVMPRPDYERFCSLYKSEEYALAYSGNTERYFLGFARVYDSKRTECRTYCPWLTSDKVKPGVWIDIFPLDSVPDDYDQYRRIYRTLNMLYLDCLKIRNISATPGLDTRPVKNLKLRYKRSVHPRMVKRQAEDYVYASNTLISTLEYGSSSHLAQLGCPDCYDPSLVYLNREDYSALVEAPFEDMTVFIPAGYHNILSGEYGDYMALPPQKKQRPAAQKYLRFYWKEK